MGDGVGGCHRQAVSPVTLPPSRITVRRSRPHFPPTAATAAQPALQQPVHQLAPLTLRLVGDTGVSRLWNEYIQRYHYLGYTPLSGSQLRYNVFAGDQLVALLSFGASAWKLAGRDRFIGWPEPQRLKNLQLVVNNARFLILPWIQSKGLASKILSISARQLPHDWHQRYGYRPVLLETFVESERHRGTCYKAANWGHVGQTAGRGKKCPVHKPIVPSRTSGCTRCATNVHPCPRKLNKVAQKSRTDYLRFVGLHRQRNAHLAWSGK